MTFYNFCTKLDSPDIHRVLPSADSEWGMNKIISVFYGPFQVSKNMFFALEKTTSGARTRRQIWGNGKQTEAEDSHSISSQFPDK